MNLRALTKHERADRKHATHNSVHIKVKIVEFLAIGVGPRDVEGNSNIGSRFIWDLDLFFFNNWKNCTLVSAEQTYSRKDNVLTNLRILFAEPSKECGNTL